MTRHEAATILATNWSGCSDAFGLTLALERLGILKLDEPKPVSSDKIKALARELSNVMSGCTCFDCLTKTLDRHDLKIVEK